MEIIPPKFIVQYLVDKPEQNFNSYADQKKIIKHNRAHTEEYVVALLHSLKGDKLVIAQVDELSLIIQIVKPNNVEFIFEERIGKWVDGADYPYYVLVAINEISSNSENQTN